VKDLDLGVADSRGQRAGDSRHTIQNVVSLPGHTRVPRALRVQENLVAFDVKKVQDNHARLADLYRRADPDLAIINAHDPILYKNMRGNG
jgi:hypothetical protein